LTCRSNVSSIGLWRFWRAVLIEIGEVGPIAQRLVWTVTRPRKLVRRLRFSTTLDPVMGGWSHDRLIVNALVGHVSETVATAVDQSGHRRPTRPPAVASGMARSNSS
jgi:hypothetical protein